MGRRILRTTRKLGFTLVELLIVVAIIGVLSTIGVPTFKKMVQKAKKSEAKVGLGGVYTAEMAFFSEYGGYGNNLKGMGYELEGSAALYTVGIPNNSCGSGTVAPDPTSTVGTQIMGSFTAYYTSANADNMFAVAGRKGTSLTCLAGTVAADGAGFIATATGCVASGCATNSTVAATVSMSGGTATATVPAYSLDAINGSINDLQDSWAIDRNRRLVNVSDGVR